MGRALYRLAPTLPGAKQDMCELLGEIGTWINLTGSDYGIYESFTNDVATLKFELVEFSSAVIDTISRLEDLLQYRLNFKGARKLYLGYNGYSNPNGSVKMVAADSMPPCAKELLDSLMLDRRIKEERERPITFVLDGLRGMFVEKRSLLISKNPLIDNHSYFTISNPTYGAVFLKRHNASYCMRWDPEAILPDTGAYCPLLDPWGIALLLSQLSHWEVISLGKPYTGSHCPRLDPIASLASLPDASCGLQKFYLDYGTRTLRKILYNGCLAISQIVLVAVIGNYKLLTRTHPTEPGSKMVGVQSAMLWPCSQCFKYLPSIDSQMVPYANSAPSRSKRN